MPNILLTSAGRRGVLVRLFQKELTAVFPEGRVFATDMKPEHSSACQLADGCFRVPRVTDESYLPGLISICRDHDIRLLIPTIDTELQLLADCRDQLLEAGITPVISGAQFVRLCRDKRLTHRFFLEHGIGVAGMVDPSTASDEDYPLFARPYDGSCSIDTYLLQTPHDLTPAVQANEKLIYQRFLSADQHDEFTVDMYYDRKGDLKCLVPRLRLETRAGEVSKGQTVWLSLFDDFGRKLSRIDLARGCLTVQVFVHRESGDLYGIEINPRFGGGFPLSCDAGANYPGWLIQEYLCDRPVQWYDGWERRLTMLRYDDHILVRDSAS